MRIRKNRKVLTAGEMSPLHPKCLFRIVKRRDRKTYEILRKLENEWDSGRQRLGEILGVDDFDCDWFPFFIRYETVVFRELEEPKEMTDEFIKWILVLENNVFLPNGNSLLGNCEWDDGNIYILKHKIQVYGNHDFPMDVVENINSTLSGRWKEKQYKFHGKETFVIGEDVCSWNIKDLADFGKRCGLKYKGRGEDVRTNYYVTEMRYSSKDEINMIYKLKNRGTTVLSVEKFIEKFRSVENKTQE